MANKPTYEELEQRVTELEGDAFSSMQSRKHLRSDRSRMMGILESIPDGVYIVDQHFNIEYINPVIERDFGKIQGRKCYQYFHERTEACPWCKNKEVFGGKSVTWEWYSFKNDRHYELFDTPIENADGSISKFEILHDITSLKRIEKALRENEERLRLMFLSSNELMSVADETGKTIWANPAWIKTLGYKPEKQGDPVENIHPDDRSRVYQIFRNINENQDGFTDIGYRYRTASGQYISLETTIRKFFAGKRTLLYVVARNVTERKMVEKALIESERKWRNVLVNTPQIGISLNPKGRIEFANAHFLKLTGWTEKEILGCDWFDTFIPHKDREEIRGVFFRVMEQKDTLGFSTHKNKIVTKTGELRDVIWSNVITKDVQGDIFDVTSLGMDYTDQKLAEDALKVSEEKFHKAFHSAPVLMSISTLEDGRYLEVNTAFVNATGYGRETTLGKTSTEIGFIASEDRSKILETLKSERLVSNLELELTHADGSKFTCLYSAEIINVEGKKRLLSIASDITEQKQVEAEKEKLYSQLLQAQKMESVGRLAGGVAHDFNNNLSVIQGYTQIALEEMNENDSHYRNLKEVLDAAKRSGALTRQLLAFARKQTISPQVLDLNDTVEGMLRMLRRLIGENIELAWHPGHNLWEIKMDPAQIDQILANLCVNARDAINDVGKVTIKTQNAVLDEVFCSEHAGSAPGEYTMLVLIDNGSGMDKTTLEQIFEPFFTTKGIGEGTGLGLSTVYGIVKQNNAFLNVYSKPGKGSRFEIYIPRCQKDCIAKRPDHLEQIPKGHGETILLVEDDHTVLDLSRTMLEKLGYEVIGTKDPNEVTKILREYPGKIHLLMTDVVMPQMNGNELVKQMAKVYPDIQTLFMSGYTADVIARQGILDEGMNFIEKPFSMNQLGCKVREVLEKKRSYIGGAY